MLNPTIPEDTQLTRSDRGRWQIPVPRELAASLQRKLDKLGFGSTLCLCPESQEACLELWPDIDPHAALDALLGLADPRMSPLGILSSPAGLN